MRSYDMEWQMKQKLVPLLFAEEEWDGAEEERQEIVSQAVPSETLTRSRSRRGHGQRDVRSSGYAGLLRPP